MEKNSAHYRGVARDNLKDNWGTAILVCLIVFGISSFVASTPVLGTIETLILTGPLTVVGIKYFTALNKKQKPTVGTAFTDFGKDFAGNVGAYTLETLYTFLWSLLFVIPGIIKSYAYSMTMFLKSKNPEMKAAEALDLSQKIMNGRKAKLFCLDISFIGWMLLSIFTLGIGLLFLLPYMNASRIAFYEDAYIEYQEQIGNIVDVDNTINNDNKIEEE
jgi:uncharacterized membrane protein